MPTLLSSNFNQKVNNNSEKSPLTTTPLNDKLNLERQLENGSIEAAIQLASIIEYNKHDSKNIIHECYNCDLIANYYILAFRLSRKNNEFIHCNSLLLSLVQQTIQLVKCHLDISKIQHLPWLPILMSELRELGKQIKDESIEGDRFIPLFNNNMDQSEQSNNYYNGILDSSLNGDYGRAIRISIYHCRDILCEDMDTEKSITYYRKCVSVGRSSLVESQKLQQSAKVAHSHLIAEQQDKIFAGAHNRPKLPSRTSSVSSGASSSFSMYCSNCSVEKRRMPVCSKCKSQYYCSGQCLKAHKPIHDLECGY